jgi:hypothetical protein
MALIWRALVANLAQLSLSAAGITYEALKPPDPAPALALDLSNAAAAILATISRELRAATGSTGRFLHLLPSILKPQLLFIMDFPAQEGAEGLAVVR